MGSDCQPCQDFQPGGMYSVHECPECYGVRRECVNCGRDHHDGGWNSCVKSAVRLKCQHPACLAAAALAKGGG